MVAHGLSVLVYVSPDGLGRVDCRHCQQAGRVIVNDLLEKYPKLFRNATNKYSPMVSGIDCEAKK
jgi:hypothetical protein